MIFNKQGQWSINGRMFVRSYFILLSFLKSKKLDSWDGPSLCASPISTLESFDRLSQILVRLLGHWWAPNDAPLISSSSDGGTARGGPWPPLRYASRSLGSLLYLSIRLYPSFSGPWTRYPAISFLVFLFVLLHTAFRTASFFGIAVSCILSICPSHLILWHLINLTMFCPLIMDSNSSFCRVLHNSFSFTYSYIFRKIFLLNTANALSSSMVTVRDSET